MVFCNNSLDIDLIKSMLSHNPYFNRWFSAICNRLIEFIKFYNVTILILIDGFLQYQEEDVLEIDGTVTILILIDGFLQSYG